MSGVCLLAGLWPSHRHVRLSSRIVVTREDLMSNPLPAFTPAGWVVPKVPCCVYMFLAPLYPTGPSIPHKKMIPSSGRKGGV